MTAADTTNQNPDNKDTDNKPAAKAANKAAETKVSKKSKLSMTKMLKVTIGRPAGNTDSHLYVGFNSFEKQVKFDTPVMLPEAVVAHLRAQKTANTTAKPDGTPTVSYSAMLSIDIAE